MGVPPHWACAKAPRRSFRWDTVSAYIKESVVAVSGDQIRQVEGGSMTATT